MSVSCYRVDRSDTHETVVLAANRLSSTLSTRADAEDADGRAGNPDERGDRVNNDPEQAQDGA